ncbi:Zn-dependent protease with chaperone function [Pseudoclavibacter chungangensis]|uniref:M48 family metallopeptidase n=1 Tax=Pseudoclavibacter chungangensis TaxID=587635 RepID=UPI0017920484|nr:M48 family metallopeptidase [Pseudoclavibacter chungangensis]NYJ67600.1 Zn-dependent protease with chaperone function [Pseudoclavibacter chungangensis]
MTTDEPPGLFRFTSTWPPAWRQAIRHPGEIPWLIVAIVLWALNLVLVFVVTGLLFSDPRAFQSSIFGAVLLPLMSTMLQVAFLLPFAYLLIRGITYAQMRTSATRMSPTQFPEGYRMVVEAAEKFGLRRVPDAYVMMGNGQVNAFAAGHGHRRFVVVYSDLFELGGEARDPDVLRFVIGHEVGHLAAGHVGYFRLVVSSALAQVPLLGNILSRAQEYTADNYGYHYHAAGASGLPRLFGAGKYLNGAVQVDEFTDRALTERGFFVWVANLVATHPVATWRSLALRNRMIPGALFLMPKGTIVGQSVVPPGQIRSADWPTPTAMLRYLDANPSAHASFPTPVMQPLPPRAPLSPGWFQPGPALGGPGRGGPTPGPGGGVPGQGGPIGGGPTPGGYGGQGYGAAGQGPGGGVSGGVFDPNGRPSAGAGQTPQGYGARPDGEQPRAPQDGTGAGQGANGAGTSASPAPDAPWFGATRPNEDGGSAYGPSDRSASPTSHGTSSALGSYRSPSSGTSDERAAGGSSADGAGSSPEVTRRSLRAQESHAAGSGDADAAGTSTTASGEQGSWPTVPGAPSAYGSSGSFGWSAPKADGRPDRDGGSSN